MARQVGDFPDGMTGWPGDDGLSAYRRGTPWRAGNGTLLWGLWPHRPAGGGPSGRAKAHIVPLVVPWRAGLIANALCGFRAEVTNDPVQLARTTARHVCRMCADAAAFARYTERLATEQRADTPDTDPT